MSKLYKDQRKQKQFVFHEVNLALHFVEQKGETTNIW
jgi:hypothetical protein